jgi:glycosyltransferase involved in cell wall biosynthesis
MKKVLILTTRPLHTGPRIIREIEALKNNYRIIAAGTTPPASHQAAFEKIDTISIVERALHKIYVIFSGGKPWEGRFYTINKKLKQLFKKYKPDIIITHECQFFPYIYRHKDICNFKVVFNAHEYHPLEFDISENWVRTHGRFYYNLYKKYLNKLDLLVNVSDGIAAKCKEEFGKDSIVIPNACGYHAELAPVLRDDAQKLIKIIHHGAAIRERKIEYMVEAVQKLGNSFQLDLMLVPGNPRYLAELKTLVSTIENVNIIAPLNFHEIVPFINRYDIGLINLPAVVFNNLHALPNKLFEFIQARLCIVVSDSPEMKKVVENNNLGLVSAGFSVVELYDCLKTITMQRVNKFKINSHNAAGKLSAERYYQYYLDAINTL